MMCSLIYLSNNLDSLLDQNDQIRCCCFCCADDDCQQFSCAAILEYDIPSQLNSTQTLFIKHFQHHDWNQSAVQRRIKGIIIIIETK